MKNKEKQIKARAEARPKKVLKFGEHEISVDERNWIVTNKGRNLYFTTLALALYDIMDKIERGLVKGDLEKSIKALNEGREQFLKAVSKAVASLERK